jgi:hypothetical protein
MDLNTLRENYANQIVDGMDLDTLMQFAYEKILENLEDMPDLELVENVKEYAPNLLNEE